MTRLYEVLFYNGWQDPPAYYLLGGVEGRSPKAALKRNLPRLLDEVRELMLDHGLTDDKVRDSLYVLRSDGLVPAWELAP